MARMVILAVVLGTALAGGCRPPSPAAGSSEGAPPLSEGWIARHEVPAAGVMPPAVIAPRHRILSPVPPILIVVPGDDGPIEIAVRTRSGGERRFLSRERMLGWPEAMPPLAVGEWGRIAVRGPTGTAVGGFVRARAPSPSRWLAGAEAELERLLGSGLPMEAFALACAEVIPEGPLVRAARLRAGLPAFDPWLADRCSDSIPPAGPSR